MSDEALKRFNNYTQIDSYSAGLPSFVQLVPPPNCTVYNQPHNPISQQAPPYQMMMYPPTYIQQPQQQMLLIHQKSHPFVPMFTPVQYPMQMGMSNQLTTSQGVMCDFNPSIIDSFPSQQIQQKQQTNYFTYQSLPQSMMQHAQMFFYPRGGASEVTYSPISVQENSDGLNNFQKCLHMQQQLINQQTIADEMRRDRLWTEFAEQPAAGLSPVGLKSETSSDKIQIKHLKKEENETNSRVNAYCQIGVPTSNSPQVKTEILQVEFNLKQENREQNPADSFSRQNACSLKDFQNAAVIQYISHESPLLQAGHGSAEEGEWNNSKQKESFIKSNNMEGEADGFYGKVKDKTVVDFDCELGFSGILSSRREGVTRQESVSIETMNGQFFPKLEAKVIQNQMQKEEEEEGEMGKRNRSASKTTDHEKQDKANLGVSGIVTEEAAVAAAENELKAGKRNKKVNKYNDKKQREFISFSNQPNDTSKLRQCRFQKRENRVASKLTASSPQNQIHQMNKQNTMEEDDENGEEDRYEEQGSSETRKIVPHITQFQNSMKNLIRRFIAWTQFECPEDQFIDIFPQLFSDPHVRPLTVRNLIFSNMKQKKYRLDQLRRIMVHVKFSCVFEFYLRGPAQQWLETAHIKSKEFHEQFIFDLLQDFDKIHQNKELKEKLHSKKRNFATCSEYHLLFPKDKRFFHNHNLEESEQGGDDKEEGDKEEEGEYDEKQSYSDAAEHAGQMPNENAKKEKEYLI